MSDKINWINGGIKKEVLYTQERRNQIFSLIQEKKSVSVRELSEVFGISGTTIRLDLTDLEKTGLITRTHGGAVLRKNAPLVNREPQIHERANQEQKARIAACAVHYVQPGDTLLLDTGTTLEVFARTLAAHDFGKNRGITIYSNDFDVIHDLEDTSFELNLLGGRVRNGFHYCCGENVLREVSRYHFRRLFLATSALSADGLTTVNSDLAELKKVMIRSAQQVILLADSSKVGLVDFQKFANLTDIQVFITDDGISPSDLDMLKEKIPDVQVV